MTSTNLKKAEQKRAKRKRERLAAANGDVQAIQRRATERERIEERFSQRTCGYRRDLIIQRHRQKYNRGLEDKQRIEEKQLITCQLQLAKQQAHMVMLTEQQQKKTMRQQQASVNAKKKAENTKLRVEAACHKLQQASDARAIWRTAQQTTGVRCLGITKSTGRRCKVADWHPYEAARPLRRGLKYCGQHSCQNTFAHQKSKGALLLPSLATTNAEAEFSDERIIRGMDDVPRFIDADQVMLYVLPLSEQEDQDVICVQCHVDVYSFSPGQSSEYDLAALDE